MTLCHFNGLGCGHEDACILEEETASTKCGIYKYLKYLDDTFEEYKETSNGEVA